MRMATVRDILAAKGSEVRTIDAQRPAGEAVRRMIDCETCRLQPFDHERNNF